MKTGILVSILVVLTGVAHELDYRDAVAQETARREFRAFVARNCIPQKPTELAMMKRDRKDGKLKCEIHENHGYGRTSNLARSASN